MASWSVENPEWDDRAARCVSPVAPAEGVAGVDEVGRGPLAGPVVAAAVLFPPELDLSPLALRDSKQLRPERRLELNGIIRTTARSFAISVVDVPNIDQLNILRASQLAMARAIASLRPLPRCALIDGPFRLPYVGLPHEAVVDGDARHPSISAASIIAKVHRDSLMERYDERYPGYGFASHKGYATRTHLAALDERGPSPIHRRSFGPVARHMMGRPA